MTEQPQEPGSFSSPPPGAGAEFPSPGAQIPGGGASYAEGAQPTASSAGTESASGSAGPGVSQRPEVAVAGTFVGGLVLATILKRLAR